MFFNTYADIIAAEILVGYPAGGEKFSAVLKDAVVKTDNLVERFVVESEALISDYWKTWGFESRTVSGTDSAQSS
jgi:hypothetical protein